MELHKNLLNKFKSFSKHLQNFPLGKNLTLIINEDKQTKKNEKHLQYLILYCQTIWF